ncbi:unnamed protein product [Victoria cruziana]
MRREGYELAVSKPRVMFKDIDGVKSEPMELVTADVEETHQGGVMQALGLRKGEMLNMEPDGNGRVRLEYRIPARGLIGFANDGKEDAIKITPPIDLTLEYGVDFIDDDELVEITPKSVRLRKRFLTENERKRAARS